MALLKKDPEAAAAKAAERETREKQRLEQAETRAREQAEAQFRSSPRGRARDASVEGETFFQISLPLSTTERTASGVFTGDSTRQSVKTRSQVHTGLLGEIESEGWRLENVRRPNEEG
jgi:hypothetical protein